jgi:5-methylcytosine-specific restriction enzyme A
MTSWITQLIAEDRLHEFYTSAIWLNLRGEILSGDHHECQHCMKHGKYSPATTVHHVKHLKEFPELALSKSYWEHGIEHRQLISICSDCHRAEHPLKMWTARPQINTERW